MDWVHLLPESQKEQLEAAASDGRRAVFICGAPGTGKGQIARWIHLHGPRSKGSMLIAHHKKPLSEQIRAAAANRDATLIIEEIGEWPQSDQRAILEQIVSAKAGKPAVRIIATTDQNLEKRTQAGLFKPELLAALNELRIEMPALSRRTAEFETITRTLLAEMARELSRPVPEPDAVAWQKLKAYDWPGNLRELRNVLKVALSTCPGTTLGVKEFPEFGYDRTDFHATRDAFEKTYLEELLRAFGGDQKQLASVTGLGVDTLKAKLQRHGLI